MPYTFSGSSSIFSPPSAIKKRPVRKSKRHNLSLWHEVTSDSQSSWKKRALLSSSQIDAGEQFAHDIWITNGWRESCSFTQEYVRQSLSISYDTSHIYRHHSFERLKKIRQRLSSHEYHFVYGVCVEMWSFAEALAFLQTSSIIALQKKIIEALKTIENIR